MAQEEEEVPLTCILDLQVIRVPTLVLVLAPGTMRVTTAETAGDDQKKSKGDGKRREREA